MTETPYMLARRAIDEVIRANIDVISKGTPEEVEGASEFVTSWFLVVETMAPCVLNGEETQAYSVQVVSADTTASRDLTPWAAKGLLHHCLSNQSFLLNDYDHFNEDEEDEDD